MKALSLHQPWATLMAIEAKRWETRGRRTHIRGRVAIHAAKKWNDELFHLSTQEPFLNALTSGGVAMPGDIAFGAIVAVGNLTACITTTEWMRLYCKSNPDPRDEDEEAFGNYDPDRFAWKFEDMRRLSEPVLCRGFQGFWNLDATTALKVERRLTA